MTIAISDSIPFFSSYIQAKNSQRDNVLRNRMG
jgi:hypothetical protein